MKNSIFSTCLCLLFCIGIHAQPGKQYPRSMTSIYNPGNTTHFLVFKPADSNSIQKHPLIIFLHGDGERGTGSNPSIIANNTGSIPYLCANNATMQFTVGGQTSSFYVLSPQCPGSNGFFPHYVKDMWAWAVSNLNVDTNRVYLTGLSYGGGGVWGFMLDSLHWTKRMTAIAPMAAIQNGSQATLKAAFTASNTSVWAFHATGDATVGAPQTTGNYANSWGFSDPNIRYTFYKNGNHSTGWTNGSDTGHTTYVVDSSDSYFWPLHKSSSVNFLQNPNVYEWFLSKTHATGIPPTVGAGSDQTIYTTSATLTGSASISSPASIDSLRWSVISGPSGSSFGSPTATTTTVTGLVPGVYVFRLTAYGSNSTSAYDEIQVTVISPNPTANAGSDQIITLPASSVTLTGSGAGVNSATITTYAWTKLSGPGSGTITSAGSSTTTVTGLTQGTYTYQLTVTDNNSRTATDNVVITVNAAPPGGCKLVWTDNPGSLGDIKTNFGLVPCDTLKIKSGTYNYLYIANSRFTGNVYVLPGDSGVVFNGPWVVSNSSNIVFKNFKWRDLQFNPVPLTIRDNTDSCTFQGFNMYGMTNYGVAVSNQGIIYDGTPATTFENLTFINDTIRNISNAPAFAWNDDNVTHNKPVTRNFTMKGCIIDSTVGNAYTLSLNANAIDLLIENCRFTNINLGGVNHNCVMYIQGNGIIRNNYAFNVHGDFMRSRPYTIDSSTTHPYPDTLWVYNNRFVSSRKYAFAELQELGGDTSTTVTFPNVHSGVGVYLNNTAGNLRNADYWSGDDHGGGGAMFDVYDWARRPIFKNNLAFRLQLDYVPDPANPPSNYHFDYMFHNGGGVKPPGEAFGDTSHNLYRHIAAQLGINDTLTMKIADTSIARNAGTAVYSYKFNTDFEGDTRGDTWDIGADENNSSSVIVYGPPYYGMDSVTLGGRKCLVKLPVEDPNYGTRTYPLILEIGDQDENAANNPNGLAGLFKSGTPRLLKDGENIYPNDLNGNPIYYIMAKIQPLNYGDVAFPNEITPFVTAVLANYPCDTSKYDNGMYRHIMLVGGEHGADAWFNCTNWAAANGYGTTPPTWVYKVSKIVTSKLNNINNGATTSTAIWQTFNGRKMRYYEPTDWNTLPDSTKARIGRNSNAYQLLYRLSTSSSQPVYDSMYSTKGVDTNTNIYRLLIDDGMITSPRSVNIPEVITQVDKPAMEGELIIRPNPASNTLTITNGKGIRSVVLYSISGQRIVTKVPANMNQIQLYIGNLPKGIYLLQVTDKSGLNHTKKIMKE